MDDIRPPHTPWLSPHLTVQDCARAVAGYTRGLGFAVRSSAEENGKMMHVELGYRDALVAMLAPEGAYGAQTQAPASLGISMPAMFYLYVDDVDATYANAVAAGFIGTAKPADMFWGDRFGEVVDPDGYRWGLARQHAPAAV